MLEPIKRTLHKYLGPKIIEVPFKEYLEGRIPTPFVDSLSDEDLVELNTILKWNCFTVDGRGRRFGDAAWKGKREKPQTIPDFRLPILRERFDLSQSHVVEVGCFEGVHTVGLCQNAAHVTAVDARVENVVKTIIRCAFFDHHPRVFKFDLEEADTDYSRLNSDVLHHVGVLYHLQNPVKHLKGMGSWVKQGLLLDTHFSLPEQATETYECEGKTYRCRRKNEFGHADVFSGTKNFSRWLLLEDIERLLTEAGFKNIEIIDRREQRNGPRVLLVAKR